MSSVISTNITSMIAQQNLNSSKSDLTTAMERLSSGMRINSAKDDAAGQAIANRMSSQITGLSQAQRNANDGISVAQTTEGALNQVNDNLQRIRELSVQASNGTNSDEDLESIQNEIGQRLNEINRISDETSFNGVKVLQQDSSLQIQVGANDGEAISINLKQINAETLGLTGFNVDGKGETPNTAATKESLTLAKATQVGDTNKYTLDTDNKAATTSDVLSLATKDSTVTVGNDAGTATYTAQEDGSFVKAQDYTNAQGADAIKDSMKPEVAGETKTATVTIGGETTKISIGSDGSIKGADSGKTLYLDTTGNLTETREGSIPAATIDNLSQSLATTDGAKIEMEDGATFENKGIVSGSELTDGTSTIAAGAIDTALKGAAGGTATGELAQVSITLNGETKTAYVDNSGNLWKSNDASGAQADDGYSFDSNGNLTDYNATNGAATTANLAGNIKNNGGSVTLEAAGTSGATTNVGTTYSANYEVGETGTPATAADIEDAIKAGAGTAAMTVEAYDDEGNSLGSQDIEFTVDTTDKKVTAIKLDGEFSAGDGADGDLGDDGETVRLSADNGSLTGAAKTTVNYWLQDNGNVTNDSGQRIYEDGEGGFTTEEVTVGDRTQDPLGVLDSALKQVDSLRSDLGAIQNRFDSAITNLSTTETNLSAARSRIEDADYATEVSNMTRAQILQQAGTSVLAQANQVPQSVLSLLG